MPWAGHPSLWVNLLCIGVGATLGAWLRWGLSLWLNPSPDRFALGTFSANMMGAYIIGVAMAYAFEHPQWSPMIRLLVMTGFLGALTTFSTFSAETFVYLREGRISLAVLYIGASLFGSLLMTALGWLSWHTLRA